MNIFVNIFLASKASSQGFTPEMTVLIFQMQNAEKSNR